MSLELSLGKECPKCKGIGFFERFSPRGDGLDYRSSCGWCKGTGVVQEEEAK